jgi:hypothetical protein
VWGDFQQPFTIYFDDVAHELLSGQHQLVVHNALGLGFEQHRTRMDLYVLRELGCFVRPVFLQFGTMVEETGCDALPDVRILIIRINRELFVFWVDFHPFHQPFQLLFDVSSSAQRTNLDVVVCAPLCAILAFLPLVVDI